MIDAMPARAVMLVVAASVCLLAGCGGGSSDSSSTTGATTTEPAANELEITVKNAAPVGGIQRITVAKGDTVTLLVDSDVADEVHVHGYNLKQEIGADGKAKISFVADVPGRFEAELENHGTQIAEVTVTP
jgi:FtsP/CotA-like multicopper oxidase with cupredoxin domain